MKIVTAILLCLSIAGVKAQTGSVVINKDPRVDLLVNKQIEINEVTTKNSRRTAPGYRIMVISSNNRNKVTEAKTIMYREFPELKAYMMYQAPFFRLKVGNFRDRANAEEYVDQIKGWSRTTCTSFRIPSRSGLSRTKLCLRS
jgi:hypothetical protein